MWPPAYRATTRSPRWLKRSCVWRSTTPFEAVPLTNITTPSRFVIRFSMAGLTPTSAAATMFERGERGATPPDGVCRPSRAYLRQGVGEIPREGDELVGCRVFLAGRDDVEHGRASETQPSRQRQEPPELQTFGSSHVLRILDLTGRTAARVDIRQQLERADALHVPPLDAGLVGSIGFRASHDRELLPHRPSERFPIDRRRRSMWRRHQWFQRHVVHERLLPRAYPFTQRFRRIWMKPLEEPCGGHRA